MKLFQMVLIISCSTSYFIYSSNADDRILNKERALAASRTQSNTVGFIVEEQTFPVLKTISCSLAGLLTTANVALIIGSAVYGDKVQIGIGAVAGITGGYYAGKDFVKRFMELTGYTTSEREEKIIAEVVKRLKAQASRRGSGTTPSRSNYYNKQKKDPSTSEDDIWRELTKAASQKENFPIANE